MAFCRANGRDRFRFPMTKRRESFLVQQGRYRPDWSGYRASRRQRTFSALTSNDEERIKKFAGDLQTPLGSAALLPGVQFAVQPTLGFRILKGIGQVAIDAAQCPSRLALDQHELHRPVALRADQCRQLNSRHAASKRAPRTVATKILFRVAKLS